MTTTAHEDQFTAAPEPVRQPYSTEAILRRNIASLEVALRTQTERAIQAERDFESLISDDNTIQEYAYELGGTDSGEYHLTAQDVARIAAKASEPYTSVLRSLASYVGAGGYNADTVDADVFEEKIRWGIGGVMARMEKAEAELAKLAQQSPIKYLYRVIDCFGHDVLRDDPKGATILETVPLYAASVPAKHKGATHCNDCGMTWLDDGLNPLGCPYCKVSVPAPAVPAEWREVIAELSADLTAHLDACYPNRDTRTRSKQFYDAQMKNVYRARALLQSAEVRHD